MQSMDIDDEGGDKKKRGQPEFDSTPMIWQISKKELTVKGLVNQHDSNM